MPYEAKGSAKFVVERVGVIAHYVEAAALRWALGTEGCDDDVSAGLDRACNLAHIRGAVFRLREEVEDGAVVPHVELLRLERERANVAAEPFDA